MNLDQQMQMALQTFVAEALELLTAMEESLLALEGGGDPEVVNGLFRAAHTIKGSAGIFGLDTVVRFTHFLENLLDRLREGEVAVTPTLVVLLLESRDHLVELVDCVAEGTEPDEAVSVRGEALSARLRETLIDSVPTEAAAVVPEASSTVRMPAEAAETGNWHLSLRFGADSLRNGLDPISFIRYLETLGEIVGLSALDDTLPALDEMDPETCYLGFEINFRSNASKEAIESVFDFVREEGRICILPANSQIGDYIDLIRSLPEDELRLGEILVRVGTLTPRELETALAEQREEDAETGNHRPVGEILMRDGAIQEPIVHAALEKQQQSKDKRGRESRFVRVPADKLDTLIDLVGELVIASASNHMLAERGGTDQQEAAAQVTRFVEEIRDGALRLRMVEIGETFSRFHRVVRDVSHELGKEIELVINGAETELDKSMVERIVDPLTHLVRNAIDHGIEPPDARAARGKPRQGRLELNARHESGSIVIEVADDGAGLDCDKILKKAEARGLISADQILADREVFNLIFEPGFSTAEKVTDLSGRGVGMDVVRRNIEAIRGTVEIESQAGQGTTMRVRLPLTLAIIDGFLVGVGGASYVVPLETVMECLGHQSGTRQGYINLRGEVVPLIRLRELFRVQAPPPRRENVVIIQYGGQRAGLIVDELHGEYQTVIKPLGELFEHLEGISGSTILGSGNVALILDVPSLTSYVSDREKARKVA